MIEVELHCGHWALAPIDELDIERFVCPVHREMFRVAYVRRADRFGRVLSERRPPQIWHDVTYHFSGHQVTYKVARVGASSLTGWAIVEAT